MKTILLFAIVASASAQTAKVIRVEKRDAAELRAAYMASANEFSVLHSKMAEKYGTYVLGHDRYETQIFREPKPGFECGVEFAAEFDIAIPKQCERK